MMSEETNEPSFLVKTQSGTLTIQADFFDGDDPDGWEAMEIDDNRVLLVHKDGKAGMMGSETGFAQYNVAIFKDFLLGLHRSKWSGVISVDTGYGAKRLFLSNGDIVFAASNVIDDRLGEVIYRQAKITLDELTTSAALVSKKQKFGQVLLTNGVFTNNHLWNALKIQVAEIIRSVFMVPEVFVELKAGKGYAPTEVIFEDGTEQIIHESYSFGCTFRDFLEGLRAESEVVLLHKKEELSASYKPGTFVGDLLQLIDQHASVQDLLNTSKLMDINTIAALAELIRSGICSIAPHVDGENRAAPELAPLKAKIDGYNYMLNGVMAAFKADGKEFPRNDLFAFVDSLNENFRSLYLDPGCALSKDCVNGVFSQCFANQDRIQFFVLRIESMIQFILQMAGDNLEWNTAKQLRSDYRAISV
jgi:hypothetical protein